MKKPLSTALKIFYGVGDCSFTLMTNMETYYFQSFLTDLAKFSTATAGVIGTVASIIDACLSWIYGAILNSIKPMKWGRYRSWLIVAPWLVPFLYAFEFLKIGNGTVAAVVIILGYVLSHIVWNLAYVGNASMIVVAASSPEDRAQLTATRGAWANLSKVLFSYVGLPLATLLAGVVGEVSKFGAAAFVLGWVMVLFYFVHFKMFEGYEETGAEEMAKPKDKQEKTSGGDLVRALFTNAPLLILMLSDVVRWIFNFVLGGIATYYFKYAGGLTPAEYVHYWPLYLLFTNLAAVIGSYVSKYFAKAFGAKMGTIIVYTLIAVALFLAKMIYASVGVWVIIILVALAQFGYGASYALIPAMYSDTVIYSEWKTGKNAAGWIMGLMNLPLKVGVIARPVIITACLAAAKYDGASVTAAYKAGTFVQTAELSNGITNAFMLIPAICMVVGIVLLLFGYRLNKARVEELQAEINARKEQA
ncbi:MAG: MFS transporter [Anaerofustis sp.]